MSVNVLIYGIYLKNNPVNSLATGSLVEINSRKQAPSGGRSPAGRASFLSLTHAPYPGRRRPLPPRALCSTCASKGEREESFRVQTPFGRHARGVSPT